METVTICRVDDVRVRILDQTLLPGREHYEVISDFWGMKDAILGMKVRGAPLIGVAGAYAIALAAEERNNITPSLVGAIAGEVIAVRPTAVNLSWACNRVYEAVLEDYKENRKYFDDDSVRDLCWMLADEIAKEDAQLCNRIGDVGSSLIKDDYNVLTHCNAGALATCGIGTALAPLYVAQRQGVEFSVFVGETRPLLQGVRLTAWELSKNGIPVTVFVDGAAGSIMRSHKIDLVIVGADRIAKNGDVANKIGTFNLAVLAKEMSIPFYVAAPYSTFDKSVSSGDRIEIEHRDLDFGFKSKLPEIVDFTSPDFDITPKEYITGYITDRGLVLGTRHWN